MSNSKSNTSKRQPGAKPATAKTKPPRCAEYATPLADMTEQQMLFYALSGSEQTVADALDVALQHAIEELGYFTADCFEHGVAPHSREADTVLFGIRRRLEIAAEILRRERASAKVGAR